MADSTPPPNTPRSAESDSEFAAPRPSEGESVTIVGTKTQPDSLPPESLSPRSSRVSQPPSRARTSTRPSIPPSEPRPLSRPGIDLRGPERATRIQLTIMLVLGLLLVAIPLYLWRRPRGDAKDAADAGALAASDAAAPVASGAGAGGVVPGADGGAASGAPLTLSEARVASCQDKGKKKTAEECDRLPAVEQALSKAVLEHGSCMADLLPGESVQFTSDVNFARKKLSLAARKAGGSSTGRLPKAARKCTEEIRKALTALSIAELPHAHARYRVVVLATFARK